MTSALLPEQVVAVVPCHREPPVAGLLERLEEQVGGVVVVLDGIADRERFERMALNVGARVLPLEPHLGKGHAIAEAIEFLRADPAAEGIVVVDCDGQHPPEAIPSFLAASATAELVIGDRFSGGGRIPLVRRVANRVASRLVGLASGAIVPDSQCGMRLLRGRALTDVEFPEGGMESETRHLKRCLRAGVAVEWVPIPAIYDGAPSSFRSLRDSGAILRAALTA